MAKPFLEITVQPIDQFHFRYDTEMNERHGSLTGQQKKTYPTVCLRNFFDGKASIQCTLYQMSKSNEMPLPHSHLLVVRNGNAYKSEPHTVTVTQATGYQATFEGMIIVNTKREFIEDKLFEKLVAKAEFESGKKLTPAQNDTLRTEAKNRADSGVDLNRVLLCFEAYTWINGRCERICEPVFSSPINEKSKLFLFGRFFLSLKTKDNNPMEFYDMKYFYLLSFLHFRMC